QVLTGHALHADRLVVVPAELTLGEAIDALHLLLLTQLSPVVRDLAATSLAVLTGRVRAPFISALVRVAAVPLQEQLHIFAPTEAAHRSGVIGHLASKSFQDQKQLRIRRGGAW